MIIRPWGRPAHQSGGHFFLFALDRLICIRFDLAYTTLIYWLDLVWPSIWQHIFLIVVFCLMINIFFFFFLNFVTFFVRSHMRQCVPNDIVCKHFGFYYAFTTYIFLLFWLSKGLKVLQTPIAKIFFIIWLLWIINLLQ